MNNNIREENGWLIDVNGNKNSIDYWGSRKKAEKALLSLRNCKRCVNCFRCYDCHDCHDCYDCSCCYDCTDCTDCSDCYGCYGCSDCSDCSSEKNMKGEGFKAPVIMNIHTKVLEAASAENALDMSNWHTCGTCHCRAGWIVHLAGEKGYALEESTSTAFAAMQIAKASGNSISPARFYDDNEDALLDMKRMSDLEKAE